MSILRDMSAELYLSSWIEIISDIRAAYGITIRRGRPNESNQPPPSSCTFTLDNRYGYYSPRNPMGPYYDSLGRNTPIRISIITARDTFNRVLASGWGTNEDGHTYTIGGSGGSVSANDFSVTGTAGVILLTGGGFSRLAQLTSIIHEQVDVAATVSIPFTNVTGSAIFPLNLNVRHQSPNEYYTAAVAINHTSGTVSIGIYYYYNGSYTSVASQTATEIVHTAGQKLRARVLVEGQTIAAKVWIESQSEPLGWDVIGDALDIRTAGYVSVESSVNSGSTNTFPIVCTIENLSIRVPRFSGEVSSWPQRWDLSGADRYAVIEAAGIKRRLLHGDEPLSSTLFRGYTSQGTGIIRPVAYWPCEDSEGAETVASAVGGPPMIPSGGVGLAAYSGYPSSAPIITMTNGNLTGAIPAYVGTGMIQARFLFTVPAAGLTDGHVLFAVLTSTGLKWEIAYRDTTGGGMNVGVWDWRTSVNYYTGGTVNWDWDGQDNLINYSMTQNGSDIDWSFGTVGIGADVSYSINGTLAGYTLGTAVFVYVDQYSLHSGFSIGHIAIQTNTSNIFDSDEELNAFAGNTTGTRISTLCGQNDIPLVLVGDISDTELVGVQRVLPVLELIDEAVAVDQGTLYESCGFGGLVYRTRKSVYNQAPTLNLDYSAGQVSAPFEPVDDDQLVRNDVTVNRINGSSAHAELTIGRMSTISSGLGGAGRYRHSVDLLAHRDNQLPDLAGWILLNGTIDEPRYPTITVNLANAAISAAGLETALLDLDIDDRITVSNPLSTQTPDLISQIVRGYTEYITPFEHTLTMNCSPASPFAVLQPGIPGHAHLNSLTSTLASGVTTVDTSLSVAFTGSRWITGSVSILIVVGGETMTVTSISGTTSPQTFTVVRSVNGVIKSHSAGARVMVFRRATLGL